MEGAVYSTKATVRKHDAATSDPLPRGRLYRIVFIVKSDEQLLRNRISRS